MFGQAYPRFVKEGGIRNYLEDARSRRAQVVPEDLNEEPTEVHDQEQEGREAMRRPHEHEDGQKNKKRKKTSGEGLSETAAALVNMMQAQRKEISRSEERDE